MKQIIDFEKTYLDISERPKREKLVSAETEISAKLTEISAEFSAETSPNKLLKNYVKWGFDFKFFSSAKLD